MEKELIIAEINETLTAFQELVSTIAEEQINIVPFAGSWTAGQVIQHVLMADSGFVEVMNGSVKETDCASDEKVDMIKKTFLDFTTKMKSPDRVIPPVKNYEKEELLSSIRKMKSGVDQAVNTLDLTKTCITFELPVFGFLTRLEAAYFILYHTQRHIRQLKNIIQ